MKAGDSECEMNDFTEPWLFKTEGMLGISEIQCFQTPCYAEKKFLTLGFRTGNDLLNELMNEQSRICGRRLQVEEVTG